MSVSQLGPVNTSAFKQSMAADIEMCDNPRQQDAEEFLSALLNKLHDEMTPSSGSGSVISNQFGFTLRVRQRARARVHLLYFLSRVVFVFTTVVDNMP